MARNRESDQVSDVSFTEVSEFPVDQIPFGLGSRHMAGYIATLSVERQETIEMEMAQAQARLELQEIRQARLAGEATAIAGACCVTAEISPRLQGVLQFPPEILRKIFLLSLSSSPFDDSGTSQEHDNQMTWRLWGRTQTTTPLTLSAVCSGWRSFAQGFPSLWNFVYIFVARFRARQQAWLLREWLSYAGNLPLTIEIDYSGDDGVGLTENTELLQTIIDYSTRIMTFRTRLSPPSLYIPYQEGDICFPRFDNLTTLSIVPTEVPSDDDDDEWKILLFQHAQRLRHIELSELTFSQLVISWQNVTKVTAMNMYLDDCIQILRATAPRVEESVFKSILHPQANPDLRPITFPQLNLLSVDFGELDVSHDLVTQIITAPKLQTLIYVAQYHDKFPTDEFVSCIKRSGCVLTDLSIINPSMTVADLRRCLSQVAPSLEHLHVKLTSDPDDQIVSINPSRQVVARAFPNLKELIFTGPIPIVDSFLEFVNYS